MAVMTYEEYKKQATTKPDDYKKSREDSYDKEALNIDTNYANLDQAAKDRADASIKDAKARYRNQYDANAIQEVLDRNAINERMANMGLTNSGLNATQQTAIALARGNRDASTTANQSQFINDTELALQDIYRQNEEKKQAEKLAAQQSRDNDIASFESAFVQGYNDYLDQENEAQKTQNELKLSIAKKLISEGKINEALSLLGGGNEETPNTVVDPKTTPYSQRAYKKVLGRTWAGDFFGGSEWFYDPIDDVTYSEEQIEEKLKAEGYTDYDIYKWRNDNNIEDVMDEMGEGEWFIPSQAKGGTHTATQAVLEDYWLNIYNGNKGAQKSALVNNLGIDESTADELVEAWYK